jgi:excisionase family DNA binding protein
MANHLATDSEPEFLMTAEAARKLKCGEAHARKLADEGALRVIRTRGGWRLFPRSEIERYLAERRPR